MQFLNPKPILVGGPILTEVWLDNNNNRRLVTLAEHTSEAPTTANKQTQAEQKGGAGPENC